MNLTVVKAIESLTVQSESMKRLAEQEQRYDLSEQIHSVRANLDGIMSVITDLGACMESLSAYGYTEEWFDVVNKDNRFIALTNLEMPKFFGTAETKRIACEGAIVDTIKVWLSKAWDFLKKLFELVIKGCRMLLQWWGATPKPTVTRSILSNVDKVLDNLIAAAEPRPQVINVEIANIFIIRQYAELLYGFCNKLQSLQDTDDRLAKKGQFFSFICAGENTGTLQQDVMSKLIAIAQDAGIQTNQPDYVGFTIDSNGLQFADIASIPNIVANIADRNVMTKIQKETETTQKLFDNIQKQTSKLIDLLQKNERAMADEFTVAKADGASNAEVTTKQSEYFRAKILLETIMRCNKQYAMINQAFRNHLLRLNQIAKELASQQTADK